MGHLQISLYPNAVFFTKGSAVHDLPTLIVGVTVVAERERNIAGSGGRECV